MAKILVTGAKGQLGTELSLIAADYPQHEFLFTDVADLDITNRQQLNDFFKKDPRDVCINCAAYTAVDKAETEKEAAENLNHHAVENLAHACKIHKTKLIHISTDFVFDGNKSIPYKEDDETAPLNFYGKSKLNGEQACLRVNPDSIIIRTSWLYSPFGNNFVKTMQRLGSERSELGVIYDQVGTPTYALDLARAVMEIISQEKNHSGIFHYSNEGVCSWYDFAVSIMQLSNLKCNVKPIETYEYPTPAMRAPFTVINKRKIKQTFGLKIYHWQESLQHCIRRIKNG